MYFLRELYWRNLLHSRITLNLKWGTIRSGRNHEIMNTLQNLMVLDFYWRQQKYMMNLPFSISTAVKLNFHFYSSNTTDFGASGVQDGRGFWSLMSKYRWCCSKNVSRTRGRGSRWSYSVLFQGEKIDDRLIFKVPTFLYFFNHDWAKSPTFSNLQFLYTQSYNNVNSILIM